MALSRKKRDKIIRFFVIFALVAMIMSSLASVLLAMI